MGISIEKRSEIVGLSQSSKRLLIATSSIGGVVAIAFIIYVVYRLREGAALVDVLKLRRVASPSTTMTANMNDCQIQWEHRYSVRSSHHPSRHQSMTIAKRRQREMPHLPLPVTQRFNSKEAYYRWYWNDRAQPTTPVNRIQSWFMNNSTPSPTTRKPSMVHLGRGRASSSASRSTRRYSAITTKSRSTSKMVKPSTESIHSIPETEPRTPGSRTEHHKRLSWSTIWTDTSAPPTPKLRIDMDRSSTGGPSKYRPIAAFSHSQMEAIDEDGVIPVAWNGEDPGRSHSGGLRTFFQNNSPGSAT